MGAERELAVIARNFEQAAATYESAALVQNAMGAELLAVLARTGLTVTGQALELGCGPGNFTERLLSALPLQRLTLNDLSPLLVERAQARASGCVVDSVVGDLTTAPVAAPFRDYDLIISNATLQWLSDLDAALSRFQALARPHGLLVYSSFLEGTFAELTELLGHSLNYLSADAARAHRNELAHIGHAGDAQRTGDFRADLRGVPVHGHLSAEDEISRRHVRQPAGQGVRGGQGIGAGKGAVGEKNALVRPAGDRVA